MAKPPMKIRNFRAPDNLWDEAKETADRLEDDLSDVLRQALTEYVKENQK